MTSSPSSPRSPSRPFHIGHIDVFPDRNLVRWEGGKATLEPLVMDALCHLARSPGDVISREDFLENVWQVSHGSDESLTRAVSILRRLWRDSGGTSPLIETVTKRGYRLVPAPCPLEGSPQTPSFQDSPVPTVATSQPMPSPGRRESSLVAGLCIAFVLAFGISNHRDTLTGISGDIVQALAAILQPSGEPDPTIARTGSPSPDSAVTTPLKIPDFRSGLEGNADEVSLTRNVCTLPVANTLG